MVPHCFKNAKNIGKRVFAEHKVRRGLLEKDAKHLYITVCRALQTYGFTFFHVKVSLPFFFFFS
jgi:hypothetical protein